MSLPGEFSLYAMHRLSTTLCHGMAVQAHASAPLLKRAVLPSFQSRWTSCCRRLVGSEWTPDTGVREDKVRAGYDGMARLVRGVGGCCHGAPVSGWSRLRPAIGCGSTCSACDGAPPQVHRRAEGAGAEPARGPAPGGCGPTPAVELRQPVGACEIGFGGVVGWGCLWARGKGGDGGMCVQGFVALRGRRCVRVGCSV